MAETPEDALDKMSGAKAHDIMLKADRHLHDNSLTMLEVSLSLRPAPDRRPLPPAVAAAAPARLTGLSLSLPLPPR